MKVKWLGHSCFSLTTSQGTVVVTDPYDESVGYGRPGVDAHLVTVSHDHHDHNCLEALGEVGQVAARQEETCVRDVKVIPFASWHDDAQGKKRGANLIYVIEADGVRLAHLGDLGHPLSVEQIEALGKLDALLIPVGGVYTIDGVQAAQLALAAGARVTVAMHFMTDKLGFELMKPEFFLNAMGKKAAYLNEFELDEKTPELIVPVLGE